MKIAIPTKHGQLHGHFGGCRLFTLIEVDPSSRSVLRSEALPAPDHQPGVFPEWLARQGVQAVIVAGIGQPALEHLARLGIQVRAARPPAAVEELVTAFLAGRLTERPSGCDHHESCE